ncbi:hypothetical protein CON46_05485 [Bacillus cereus]|nr:hypothetical protein CON46_05485 [Bacillus cereus]
MLNFYKSNTYNKGKTKKEPKLSLGRMVILCEVLTLVNEKGFFYDEIKSQYIFVVTQHFYIQRWSLSEL